MSPKVAKAVYLDLARKSTICVVVCGAAVNLVILGVFILCFSLFK